MRFLLLRESCEGSERVKASLSCEDSPIMAALSGFIPGAVVLAEEPKSDRSAGGVDIDPDAPAEARRESVVLAVRPET